MFNAIWKELFTDAPGAMVLIVLMAFYIFWDWNVRKRKNHESEILEEKIKGQERIEDLKFKNEITTMVKDIAREQKDEKSKFDTVVKKIDQMEGDVGKMKDYIHTIKNQDQIVHAVHELQKRQGGQIRWINHRVANLENIQSDLFKQNIPKIELFVEDGPKLTPQ